MMDLKKIYDKLVEEHKHNLARYGVKMPKLYSTDSKYAGNAIQLCFLRQNFGKLCHKDDIAEVVKTYIKDAARDQQPRHLKRYGWDIRGSGRSKDVDNDGNKIPQGCYLLASITSPHPDFLVSEDKRAVIATAKTWEDLLRAYKYRCGLCGKDTKQLDKGHKNPKKAADISNLIPLCISCNNWVSNDVILDDDGYVKTILPTERFFLDLSVRELTALESIIKKIKQDKYKGEVKPNFSHR